MPSTAAAIPPVPAADVRLWRDPLLPHVELRQASHSRACYVPHSHPSYSIGAIDSGHSLFTGAQGGRRHTGPGTLVYVPPAHVHACNPASLESWSYHMLHLDAAWVEALRIEHAALSGASIAPRYMDQVMLATAPPRYAAYRQLAQILGTGQPACAKDAALIEFVMDSDTRPAAAPLPPLARCAPGPALLRVMDALRDDPAANPSLAGLAALAGMGRYQLIRAFRAATGMTPHAYQLDFRINQARDWLRQGASLADTAYRLGFADQSHFQRMFKARAAMPPGRYRSGA